MIDLDFDKQHIWHPYTSLAEPLPVHGVKSASGVHIELEDGRCLIDGMASWWCVIHGYNRPELNAAAQAQLQQMSHVMFGGLSHEPGTSLARKLVQLTPEGLEYLFFSDSGSVAVEVAIKMAVQYWQAQGKSDKQRLLALRGAYHGDTFAAMSVCDPVTGMHERFRGVLMENYFAERPACRFGEPCRQDDLTAIRNLLEVHCEQLAAVILEPVVQGAGGMYFYSADYLSAVRELCDKFGVLLIADEIATGFGRTGKLFACEHARISPDILCLGKALTGGYLSLAATLCNEKVAAGISRDGGVFMHGPTFMGNPLACSIANASVDLLLSTPWQSRIEAIESQLKQELGEASELPSVTETRALGAIGVIEMKAPVDVAKAQSFFVERGVWIRPFGKMVYIMPPYIIAPEELSIVTGAMVEFASSQGGR